MILPKGYFSWSQYDLWKRSKKDYYDRYVLNKPFFETKYIKKGKEFALAIATGEVGRDENLNNVMVMTPRGDIFEYEFNVRLKNGEIIRGFIDSAMADGTEIHEYKTGKVEWDAERVKEHTQLAFYALAIFKQYNFIPTAYLTWIETIEDIEGNLIYSGRVEYFPREFTVRELLDFEDDVCKVIEEIKDYDYVEMPLEEDLLDEYIRLEDAKKEIDARIAEIRDSIMQDMVASGLENAVGSKGKFTLSKRGTWTYSSAVKELQKEEQKSGIATQSFSTSLRFTKIKGDE